MTDLVKRYALSSSVTFLSTFLLILSTNIGAITNPSELTLAFMGSVLLIAVRAAVKAVIEAIAGGHADLPSITPTTPAQ